MEFTANSAGIVIYSYTDLTINRCKWGVFNEHSTYSCNSSTSSPYPTFKRQCTCSKLQAGVNLVIHIRDFLGHVSVQTTEVYARADSKQKREALQKAYVEVKPNVDPLCLKNKDLLGWLKSF